MSSDATKEEVVKVLQAAKMKNVQVLADVVMNAIELYQEYKVPKYYSHPRFSPAPNFELKETKQFKRPLKSHHPKAGRFNQEPARIILISLLATVWIRGMNQKPTVSDKRYADSPFLMFVGDIFKLVGIGKVHKHLERYVSVRKSAQN